MIQINTKTLKNLVAKARKGAGYIQNVALTSMIGISCHEHTLMLQTTDDIHYLYVSDTDDNMYYEDFRVVILLDQFNALLSKLTCDTISMEIQDRTLIIYGNGDYKLPIPVDIDAQFISFPDPAGTFNYDTWDKEINKSTIMTLINTVKPSLLTKLTCPCYTGYYFGDSVVATDRCKMADLDVNVFGENKLLLYADTIDLLGLCDSDVRAYVDTEQTPERLCFTGDGFTLYCMAMDCIDTFNIEGLRKWQQCDCINSCEFSKAELIQALDRLNVFVGPYDNKCIVMEFEDNQVRLSSRHSEGVEYLSYLDNGNHANCTYHMDISLLIPEVKATGSDTVTIRYGNPMMIRIEDTTPEGKVQLIIAALDH